MIAWAWWVGIFNTNTNCKAVSFRDEWSVAEVGCGTELVATVAEAVMLQQQQQQQHSFSRDITLLRSLAHPPIPALALRVQNLGHEALIEPPPPQTLPESAARRGLFGGCIGHMSGHGLELDAEVPFSQKSRKSTTSTTMMTIMTMAASSTASGLAMLSPDHFR